MKDWLFAYYLTILIFSSNKIGSVNKELPKSFDEIFGEGWEEREQNAKENLEDELGNWDGIGQNQIKVLQSDQNNYLDQINNKRIVLNESDHKNDDQSEKNMKKREIVQKFRAIKEKIKEKGIKCSREERYKIERTIAKKLGTNRNKIYKWINELGYKTQNIYLKKQKMLIIQKFMTMCDEYKQKGKHSRMEWQTNYTEISKKIGVCYSTIHRWKKQFGMRKKNYKIYSKKQKIESVQKFIEMCNDYKQKRTYSAKEWRKNYGEISNKLRVCQSTIQKWKKELEMRQKTFTNEEKLEIVKKYWEMKRNTPKISDVKIAKQLNINVKTIRRWNNKFF